MRSCVYKLLSYHVSFENVGPVIKTVLSMIGVATDHLPSDRTVAQFNEERLLISQHQLGKLTQEKNLTLGTDETPKNGDIYNNNNNNKVFISGHAQKSNMYNSSNKNPNIGCSSTRTELRTYIEVKKNYICKYKHLNQ